MTNETEITTRANLTCPYCGTEQEAEMPTDVCQFFYECTSCHKVLKPLEGDCCVFCSYADHKCPSMQVEASS